MAWSVAPPPRNQIIHNPQQKPSQPPNSQLDKSSNHPDLPTYVTTHSHPSFSLPQPSSMDASIPNLNSPMDETIVSSIIPPAFDKVPSYIISPNKYDVLADSHSEANYMEENYVDSSSLSKGILEKPNQEMPHHDSLFGIYSSVAQLSDLLDPSVYHIWREHNKRKFSSISKSFFTLKEIIRKAVYLKPADKRITSASSIHSIYSKPSNSAMEFLGVVSATLFAFGDNKEFEVGVKNSSAGVEADTGVIYIVDLQNVGQHMPEFVVPNLSDESRRTTKPGNADGDIRRGASGCLLECWSLRKRNTGDGRDEVDEHLAEANNERAFLPITRIVLSHSYASTGENERNAALFVQAALRERIFAISAEKIGQLEES
ncbi:hypothetical protein M5K25_016874 [Dendrobium thyrsiflorum]|uniref:Uncharacterized protein n=1 Tax=Dendrobium thyrsiflorum TaxID=117978 RepID=A0ABD0UKV4_DENTH